MRVLALDSSGPDLSAAAADEGNLRACRRETLGRGHAERILPMLAALLPQAGWRWPDIELIAVTLGPGNFTGLRAGIAVARALCLALDRPALGIGTLETVAQAAAAAGLPPCRELLVAMDARREEVYAQRFDHELTPLDEPALQAPAGLRIGAGCILVGDRAPAIAAAIGGRHAAMAAAPDAAAVAMAAWRRLRQGVAPMPGTALRPVYVRPPDARPGAGASLLAAP